MCFEISIEPIITSLFQTSEIEFVLNAAGLKRETFTIDLPTISTKNGPFRSAYNYIVQRCEYHILH